MDKVVIIDGNSLINRAFYAIPPLSNNGVYTNAVYGFANMLIKVIAEIKPKFAVVAFDVKSPTFRHVLYKDYKATRKPMSDELASQLPIVKQMLQTMGIKILEKPGIEADDIIGTLSKRFNAQSIILTGDKDCLQLIDKKTNVYLTKKGITEIEIMNEQAMQNCYGLTTKQFIDLKALMGDASDNIPGCSGVGEKTALDLLKQYGDLEGIYQNIDGIKGKLQEKLTNCKDIVFLSRKLATIDIDAEISCVLEDCNFKYPFNQNVYNFFEKYDFKSLLKRTDIFEGYYYAADADVTNIVEITDLDAFKKLISSKNKIAVILDSDIYLAFDNSQDYKVSIKKDLISAGVDYDDAIKMLKPLLEDSKIEKFVSNKKVLLAKNFNMQNVVLDARLANFLLTSKVENLKSPSMFFDLTAKLKSDGMEELYFKMEHPLIDVLYKMEQDGFKIDLNALEALQSGYNAEIAELMKDIFMQTGEQFNINSTQQLSNILFNKLGLKPGSKTKEGFSTGIEILENLQNEHPIVPMLIRYRKITKLQSVYIVGFKNLLTPAGFVHTSFNQTGAVTGRISSAEPNLQNIPIRTPEGRNLRKLFVSRFEDGQIVSADYSQIELRLLAHLSGDPNLVEAFSKGQDIHIATAQRVFGTVKVDSDMRRSAKTINFGIIYGMSAFGLSESLGCTPAEAQRFIDLYFAKFPTIKSYLDSSIETAKKIGYAITIFNRRRYIPELFSDNKNIVNFASRAAMNMPCQGSASDIIKLAMVQIAKQLEAGNFKTKMLVQVHDELVFDCPGEEVERVKQIVKQTMEGVVKLKVPLIVDIQSGKDWFDAK